ncbi:hypothetical protein LCGC14_0945990 [marine sediment metagenome]|uniref:Uncharacterized protein n=1 Tax=marine sediment metagenome TaxID=412755 RepID=A0A0F9RQ18_9ZZZZ
MSEFSEIDKDHQIGAHFTYAGCPLVKMEMSGDCPVQSTGEIGDYEPDSFYFRARHESWSFEVYDGSNENKIIYSAQGDYGNEFSASWMPISIALKIVGEQINTFWLKHGAFRRIKKLWGNDVLVKFKQKQSFEE